MYRTTPRKKLEARIKLRNRHRLVLRFEPQDWKVASLEAFNKHIHGQITYREAELLQRKITDAMVRL